MTQETDPQLRSRTSEDDVALVWLAPLAPEAAMTSVGTSASRERKAYAGAVSGPTARREPVHRQPPGNERSAPGTESATPVLPEIDWHAELGPAAARQLEREAEERKQAAARDPRKTPGSKFAQQPTSGWDGWDFAATHRYTAAPEGKPAVNVNDRCIITFPFVDSAMYRFGCNIGKIAPHTDLFQHASDSSPL